MEANRPSGWLAFARLFWMAVGSALLFLLAGTVARNGVGWLAPASLALLAVLPVMIVARWLDSHNSYGDPTTPAEILRYTVGIIMVGLAVWGVANLVGNHWPAP
jgi:hypothetical protein